MVSFGAKPAEGVDPWKAARDAYDTTLENAIVQVETTANAAATKTYADGIKATADAALPSASFDTRLATRVKVDNAGGRTTHVWDATNNRWQRVYLDTGYRDITALLVNGWTATQVQVRRMGDSVTMIFRGLNGEAAASTSLFANGTLPGFGTNIGYNTVLQLVSYTASPVNAILAGNTDLRLTVPVGTKTSTDPAVRVSFDVGSPAPSSLPGAAVGGIPNT